MLDRAGFPKWKRMREFFRQPPNLGRNYDLREMNICKPVQLKRSEVA